VAEGRGVRPGGLEGLLCSWTLVMGLALRAECNARMLRVRGENQGLARSYYSCGLFGEVMRRQQPITRFVGPGAESEFQRRLSSMVRYLEASHDICICFCVAVQFT
jgi:hypothetical protein